MFLYRTDMTKSEFFLIMHRKNSRITWLAFNAFSIHLHDDDDDDDYNRFIKNIKKENIWTGRKKFIRELKDRQPKEYWIWRVYYGFNSRNEDNFKSLVAYFESSYMCVLHDFDFFFN